MSANNMCQGCHHNPGMIGQKIKGMPTSIPQSHYTDLRNTSEVQIKTPVGARYVCTQCHVPQANVQPLVGNTFQE
ncbi:MAG: nitrate reductase cytochrome c-type subunit [Gammaproteobacteria bacterium]|nr:nitrate reductase cytochrome c-type subunit [Gammaproteobacteria bacterium]